MSSPVSEKKTPLHERHEEAGGKIVSFAGYLLPVQYSGVIAEHMAVRTKAGLFDVSHMGELILKGPDAVANLNNLLTNDYTVMEKGQARYSPMCNENGGVVDDLIVYKYDDLTYFIVVNAANKDKDFNWIKNHLKGDAICTDISDETAQIAIQGPLSEKILGKVTGNIPARRYFADFEGKIKDIKCNISRTGYTGEDGFELYCKAPDAVSLWDILLEAGRDEGLIPCGLGARDTLRLEAAMPLYGHEMDDNITPIETGLSYFVKLDKENFIGKEGMIKKGKSISRIGLKITDRGIVRENCDVFCNGKKVGKTTSGTHCPYLGGAYAMALVDSHAEGEFEVLVREKRLKAELVKLPFYKKEEK